MTIVHKLMHAASSILERQIVAIELSSGDKDQSEGVGFTAVLLKVLRKETTIVDRVTSGNREALNEWLVNNDLLRAPVCVLINSDSILHKVCSSDDHEDGDGLSYFSEIVTDQNKDSFYTQVVVINESQLLCSLMRKQHIDDIVSSLDFFKENILSVSVGFFPMLYTYSKVVEPGIDNQYRLTILHHEVSFFGVDFSDFKIAPIGQGNSTREFFRVSGGQYDWAYYLSYSLGSAFIMDPASIPRIDRPDVRKRHEEFLFRRKCKPVVMSFLITLLVVLVSTAFIRNSYSREYAELLKGLERRKILQGKEQVERQIAAKKQALLADNGLLDESNVSVYSDQITAGLPNGIYLRKLEIHPIKKGGTFSKEMFNENLVLIEGNCYSTDDFNEWISDIRTYRWVSDIIIAEYKHQGEDDIAAFKLEVIKR